MHKLRLHFLLIVVVACGATCVAQSQDGTAGLEDQVQNKFSDKDQDQPKANKKHEKVKTKNEDDGHRRHWWSLPHFRHKHDKDAAAGQPPANANRMTAARKPMKDAPAPKADTKTAAIARSRKSQRVAAKQGHNTVATTGHANSTVAAKRTPTKAHSKAVASTNQAGKPARQNCTAAEGKKGGCQSVQKHTSKPATRTS